MSETVGSNGVNLVVCQCTAGMEGTLSCPGFLHTTHSSALLHIVDGQHKDCLPDSMLHSYTLCAKTLHAFPALVLLGTFRLVINLSFFAAQCSWGKP